MERLQRDLLGPIGADDEIITDAPITTYAAGILFPGEEGGRRDDTLEDNGDVPKDFADETDGRAVSDVLDEDAVPDTGVSLANLQRPSSMGLTFAVDPTVARSVTVTVSAAVYEPINAEGDVVTARRAEARSTEQHDQHWRRRPLSPPPIDIDITKPALKKEDLGTRDLELRYNVRKPSDGAVAVTVTLVNARKVSRSELQDPHCFFQPTLHIAGPDGTAALVERPVPVGVDEEEVKLNKLLHRHAPTFAVGHGCAADWNWTAPPMRGAVLQKARKASVPAVWSAFVPSYELLLTDSNRDIDAKALGMLRLSEASDAEIIGSLTALATGYRTWIAERGTEAEQLADTEYAKTARTRIKECGEVASRIERGIEVLESDRNAMTAFRLANRAMAEQRGRTSWIRDGRSRDLSLDGEWRPFQIAFILLCLQGIVDHDHPERAIADVLWFPTGGGKTEAYLGLIAFTVFLRRLRNGAAASGGVTALMRYTLRLLTLQQFERATALICAMESIRRRDPARLGDEGISIGMWVGSAATPNDLKTAAKSLRTLRKDKDLTENNPVQLRVCPWSGAVLGPAHYDVDLDRETMTVSCPDADCEFRDGLPIHLVDEEIYRVRPTLVIATVDKFAMLTWRDDVAALFNRDRPGTPPPELIVQDELHLISGPLGTLAGLYEVAVDVAAGQPKVVASTATIRRATEQGRALFDRTVSQFPPAGLDSRDSWFAVETPPAYKASRLYVGLMTPSTSQATLLVRAYAALLHGAAAGEGPNAIRDAYWTLVGYFNSLRLLAAAELQVHDDVQDRLALLTKRDGVERQVERPTELTSRVKSSEIPTRLKELEIALPAGAFDTVLATSMISVGVDVDRLGLMAVMGQPQTTAEYIQATSRVGRQHPGLVVTLYNAARSRDRSHYETFTSYHSALYRQVESTSVTPFSARARDRALHSVLIGLTRLMVDEARPNRAAQDVEDFVDRIEEVTERIVTRAASVAPDEAKDVAEHLAATIEHWRYLADRHHLEDGDEPLLYSAQRSFKRSEKRAEDAALIRRYSDEDLELAFMALQSMRDVDVESDLYLEH
ncbi:helicase-related protein [Actinomadura sp. NPDC023710]|uniref:helicase-related protein n=1 Tax=Actinomadura sp. NPDC023710 TaxID=3158219 RepID=UPI0033F5155A